MSSRSRSKMKAVIFGTGDIAQIAAFYFERDAVAEVVAFTVDRAYLPSLVSSKASPSLPSKIW